MGNDILIFKKIILFINEDKTKISYYNNIKIIIATVTTGKNILVTVFAKEKQIISSILNLLISIYGSKYKNLKLLLDRNYLFKFQK